MHYNFGPWLAQQSDAALQALLGLGHPSVSAHFSTMNTVTADTKPTGDYGSAFFGGELNDVGGAWTINNHSGRHSNSQTSVQPGELLNAGEWRTLMQAAQALFKQQMGIDVGIGDVKSQG